ncbi:MAG TPA: methionyl-tRNA formyltransferase [Burkholderiales bacterium]|nr:methionyl-tRNA formyltransferase [Burkholderiales bacterium]
MRLIFAGTAGFAARALGALVEAGYEVVLVLTPPDKPAGRGLNSKPSAVKTLALERRLSIAQPSSLKPPEVVDQMARANADVIVAAAYGLIFPAQVLALPRLGCVNIHASLLPRWRGAAPIQRAIMAGDRETGISIMQMDPGLDTGPVFVQERVSIQPDDTAGTLHDRLAELGAALIVRVLAELDRGAITARPQPLDGVTYAEKVGKSEAAIDWRADAVEIDRLIRALNPEPGAYGILRGERLKVWRAALLDHVEGAPGEIVEAAPAGVHVACGRGGLRLEELQRPGGRPLAAEAFQRGFTFRVGERLA